MKRCLQCKRIYTDDAFQFCLEDGADLVLTADDENETENFRVSGVKETEKLKISGTKETSSKGKWLVFSLAGAVIILIFFGLTATALYFALRDGTKDITVNNSNGASPIFSSSADDETELKNIMQKMSVAFVKNDKQTLDYYLADEYKEENSNGESYTKKEVMNPTEVVERESLKYFDLKVTVNGEKADMSGNGELKYSLLGVPVTQKFNFKAQFVKRGNHWQGVYSYSEFLD